MTERLTNARLLDLWEAGRQLSPYQAADLLLRATLPPETAATVDRWTIGQRDRHLLRLREALFGDALDGVAHCPRCGEKVEFTLSTRNLLLPAPDDTPPEHSLETGEYRVTFRAPTLGDLAAALPQPDAQTALLARCITAATRADQPVPADALPPAVLGQLSAAIGKADPQAQIDLALDCPACAYTWQAPFDILHYLWREIDVWARRVLREVHLIAGAYGWPEAEILRLSPARRRLYLELILGVS
ncbi:MAG: hypothetical protein Kow0077_23110 [Anaerolineae bacterium]